MKNIILLICLALGVGLLTSCKKDQIKMVRVDFYEQKGRAEVTVLESNNTSRTFIMNARDEFDMIRDQVSTITFKAISESKVRVNGSISHLYPGEIFVWDKSKY